MKIKLILCTSVLLTACSSGTYVTDVTTESFEQDYGKQEIEPILNVEEQVVTAELEAPEVMETAESMAEDGVEETKNVFSSPKLSEPATPSVVDIEAPTNKQLQAAARFGYTIQVAAVSSETEAKVFAGRLPQEEPIWENYKTVNGTTWFTVLYGDYATKTDAQDAIKAMPSKIRALKPFVKSIDDIKNSPYPSLKKLN